MSAAILVVRSIPRSCSLVSPSKLYHTEYCCTTKSCKISIWGEARKATCPNEQARPSVPPPLPLPSHHHCPWGLRAGGRGEAVATTSINTKKPPQAFCLVEMRTFPGGFLRLLWDNWTQKMLPNESEMRAGKGRGNQAYPEGRREIKGRGSRGRARENAQLKEWDEIKTTSISFRSSLSYTSQPGYHFFISIPAFLFPLLVIPKLISGFISSLSTVSCQQKIKWPEWDLPTS